MHACSALHEAELAVACILLSLVRDTGWQSMSIGRRFCLAYRYDWGFRGQKPPGNKGSLAHPWDSDDRMQPYRACHVIVPRRIVGAMGS
ncbi:hypothetical protein IF1G_00982 [Cordyceps javanica]|uniref:Uncharacterized protein n=1 Tax=Cordyceps javanica TaxID=43265 RepID=A0A545VH65_9HYPO|nr:hypothetical protein IF1G_00982 [Cordyceps javanica]